MTLDKHEASAALAEIDASQARGRALYSYGQAAPYFFVTGLLWFVADMLMQFSSLNPGLIWPVCSGLATFVYLAVVFVQARARAAQPGGKGGRYAWRVGVVWLIVFAFMVASFAIFTPFNGYQSHSFIGLFIGAVYAALGLWMGWRLVAVGVLLAGLSVAGYFEIRTYYDAFMAVVGGGGMMLGALWLRRV